MKIYRTRSSFPLILTLLLVFFPFVSFDAAWTQGKGFSQLILNLNAYFANQFFNQSGEKIESGQEFTKLDFNPFFEYGINNDLTIGMNHSLQYWQSNSGDLNNKSFDFRQCGFSSEANFGQAASTIYQADFFVRKKLFEHNNFILSVQPLIQTPCLIYHNDNLFMPYDNVDLEFRLLGGYGFKWDPESLRGKQVPFAGQYHFMDLEVAYRERMDDFADQVKIDGTLGFRYNPDTLVLGQAFSVLAINDEIVEAVQTTPGSYVFREDNFSSVKLQLSTVRQINEKSSIQFGVFSEVYGKNSGAGNGVIVAWWRGF